MVLLTVVVGAIALLVASVERQSDAHFAGLALLLTGITGLRRRSDLGVLFASWQVILLAWSSWGGRVLEERRPERG